ncbi:MAG: hypothetical protein Q8P11_01475 [bacterium]|nr:hypothetical protein [bacterium]
MKKTANFKKVYEYRPLTDEELRDIIAQNDLRISKNLSKSTTFVSEDADNSEKKNKERFVRHSFDRHGRLT